MDFSFRYSINVLVWGDFERTRRKSLMQLCWGKIALFSSPPVEGKVYVIRLVFYQSFHLYITKIKVQIMQELFYFFYWIKWQWQVYIFLCFLLSRNNEVRCVWGRRNYLQGVQFRKSIKNSNNFMKILMWMIPTQNVFVSRIPVFLKCLDCVFQIF